MCLGCVRSKPAPFQFLAKVCIIEKTGHLHPLDFTFWIFLKLFVYSIHAVEVVDTWCGLYSRTCIYSVIDIIAHLSSNPHIMLPSETVVICFSMKLSWIVMNCLYSDHFWTSWENMLGSRFLSYNFSADFGQLRHTRTAGTTTNFGISPLATSIGLCTLYLKPFQSFPRIL